MFKNACALVSKNPGFDCIWPQFYAKFRNFSIIRQSVKTNPNSSIFNDASCIIKLIMIIDSIIALFCLE